MLVVRGLIIVGLYFAGYFDKLNYLYKESSAADDQIRQSLIEARANSVINTMKAMYAPGKYPAEMPEDILAPGFEFSNNLVQDEEKKYLGKVVEIDDFRYQGNGYTYELCIKPEWGGRCWARGKPNK